MSLRRIRWAQYLMYGNGFEPWLVAYMTARHLSWNEILLLLTIQQLVGFPLQYPTGRFADKRSRTMSLTIGSAACLLSMSLYALATTAPLILMASLTGVAGRAFFSGADEALARGMHRQQYGDKWKDRFGLFKSRFARYQGLSEAATCVLSTILATTLGLEALVVAQGLIYLAIAILVLTLVEPDPVTKQDEEPTRYKRDPTVASVEILASVNPGVALALALSVSDPTFKAPPAIAKEAVAMGIGDVDKDGRLIPRPSFTQLTYTAPTQIYEAEKRRVSHRWWSFYVVQMPPTSRTRVIKVRSIRGRDGKRIFAIVNPDQNDLRWTIVPRPLVGGAWVATKGPERELTKVEYEGLVKRMERREKTRKWLLLAALIVGVGAVASLTAVTYRIAPLYYATIHFRGRPLPTSGYGWVWTAYLASTWAMGLGYRSLSKLSFGKTLGVMAGLAALGGVCYVVFGLVGAVWGLSAMIGLALVREQETALSTKLFNELSSTRNQAVVLSMLNMMQDGMAAGAMLMLAWWTHDHSLSTGLIGIGVIHAVVACLAFGVLLFSYRP